MTKARTVLLSFLAVLGFVGVGRALAQSEVERFDRQLEQIRRDTRVQVDNSVPIGERAYFDYGAYTTFSYLSFDDANLNNRGLRQYNLTAYANLKLDGANEFFFRGNTFLDNYNEGDRLNNQGKNLDGQVERAYYKFDLAGYLAGKNGDAPQGDLWIKGGRDLVVWGNGLTLSEVLDGIVSDVTVGPITFETLAAVTPPDTVDFDSSRPSFDSHTRRGFYGEMVTLQAGQQRPYAYFLDLRDYNNDGTFDYAPSAGTSIPTRFDYNSYYFGIGCSGPLNDRLRYAVEATNEGGHGLSNSFTQTASGLIPAAQTRSGIEAYAGDGLLDYLVGDAHETRLSAEAILASGDRDRLNSNNTIGGNRPGSHDRGFNGFGLLNTGLALAPSVSNLMVFRLGASALPLNAFKPFARLQLGGDFFVLSKFDGRAPIDEPTNSSGYLGVEQDLYLNWQITSDVSLAVRYGAFIPGDAIQGGAKVRQFIYTGVTYAF